MKPTFGSNLTVVYKDTDSYLYRIQTDDLYSDMESFENLLDLSDYPKTRYRIRPLKSSHNERRIEWKSDAWVHLPSFKTL